jgi:hypothetical protein
LRGGRNAPRFLGRGFTATLLTCASALLTASATSAADAMANIPIGVLPAACDSAPHGPVCEQAAIDALDLARTTLGLGPYLLPPAFVTLGPGRQWLILANLDRLQYSLLPIVGLNRTLDTIAERGASTNDDPNPWPFLRSLHTVAALGFASDWAGGFKNALVAYYEWMYNDGYGGPNLDCTSPSDAGCWGHRRVILAFAGQIGGELAMGAAVARGKSSYALTIVDTSAPVFHYDYTWAQAQTDGAGQRHG